MIATTRISVGGVEFALYGRGNNNSISSVQLIGSLTSRVKHIIRFPLPGWVEEIYLQLNRRE